MQIHLHQTHHSIADFSGVFETLKKALLKTPNSGANNPQLHLFPELYLTGYPLMDLVLQRPFINQYQKLVETINAWSISSFKDSNASVLLGGLEYQFDDEGLPVHIYNVIYRLEAGSALKKVYTKILLPNYDIFDEEKYFTPGTSPNIMEVSGKKVGLLICEDMWTSTHHPIDPVQELFDFSENGQNLDLIVNLSASPFHLGKEKKRHQRGIEISQKFSAPFFYVNRVGGEDEILFDGGSFAADGDQITFQGSLFKAESKALKVSEPKKGQQVVNSQKVENTWEDLFRPNLEPLSSPPKLFKLEQDQLEITLHALAFGLQEYASKNGFKKFLVALSGGIDSALVLTIIKLALKPGQEVEALYMPSIYSATESYELSAELCKNLAIPLKNTSHQVFPCLYQECF